MKLRKPAVLALLALALLSPASTTSSNEMRLDDSINGPSWLNELLGEEARAWVASENSATISAISASERYAALFRDALHVLSTPSQSDGDVYVYRGVLYQHVRSEAHPRGLLRETTVSSFLSNHTRWSTTLDIDALSAAQGRDLDLAAGRPDPCFEHRCLVVLGFRENGRRMHEIREFDLRTREFVTGGFYIPRTANPNVSWRDENTLLLTQGLEILAWRRGTDLATARRVYAGTPADISVAALGFDGRTIIQTIDARAQSSFLLLLPDGRQAPLYFPPTTGLIRRYNDFWILRLNGPWHAPTRVWPAGSWLAIRANEATRATAQAELLLEEREGEEGQIEIYPTAGAIIATTMDRRSGGYLLWNLQRHNGIWSRSRLDAPIGGLIRFIGYDGRTSSAIVTYQDFVTAPSAIAIPLNRGAGHGMPVDRATRSRYLVEHHTVRSDDGTLIPYFLVRNSSYHGCRPTLMRVHGSGSNAMIPTYDAVLRTLWLDRGGSYVLAQVRGGMEFGRGLPWHVVGVDRERTIEDVLAITHDLYSRHVISEGQLGLQGHSNGGALVGAVLNRRPDLFSAALIQNPVLDLTLALGRAPRSNDEFGSGSTPEERQYVESVSPIQNLSTAPFPTVFISSTTTDTRVPPTMARRYAARLGSLGHSRFYFEPAEGGHGFGLTPDQIALHQALTYEYLHRQLRFDLSCSSYEQ